MVRLVGWLVDASLTNIERGGVGIQTGTAVWIRHSVTDKRLTRTCTSVLECSVKKQKNSEYGFILLIHTLETINRFFGSLNCPKKIYSKKYNQDYCLSVALMNTANTIVSSADIDQT